MGIFSMESGFYKTLSRLLDFLKLNILWLIFSLPIVTIGASTTAAFSVSLKMAENEEGYVARQPVKALWENLNRVPYLD